MSSSINPEKMAFSIKEVCAVIGCKPGWLYDRMRDGSLKPKKIAGRTFILRTELERFMGLEVAA